MRPRHNKPSFRPQVAENQTRGGTVPPVSGPDKLRFPPTPRGRKWTEKKAVRGPFVRVYRKSRCRQEGALTPFSPALLRRQPTHKTRGIVGAAVAAVHGDLRI